MKDYSWRVVPIGSHPAARRAGLAAAHEGRPDIVAALLAAAAAPTTFEAAGGGSDYRQLARRTVLEVAQFCGDWLMSWERPGSSLATLCRTWFAWAGDRVRVPAAAVALLAAAPAPYRAICVGAGVSVPDI